MFRDTQTRDSSWFPQHFASARSHIQPGGWRSRVLVESVQVDAERKLYGDSSRERMPPACLSPKIRRRYGRILEEPVAMHGGPLRQVLSLAWRNTMVFQRL